MKGLRILAALALLCGCATQRAWVYAPTLPPVPGGPRPERTVVLPFRDARPIHTSCAVPAEHPARTPARRRRQLT